MAFKVTGMNYDFTSKWMNVTIHQDQPTANVTVNFSIEDKPTEPGDTLEDQAKKKAKEMLQEALGAL